VLDLDAWGRENTMGTQNSKGFTLIELMITLVVIGIIAAIAIPNLVSAIDRGKQKRTMADMRTIGTAVEAYAVDNSQYPISSDTATLWSQVSPTYLRPISRNDGWDHEYVVNVAATEYTISSTGKDGVPSGCVVGTYTTQLTEDICFAHGSFVQYPVGRQN
jgi:general secretion pathway protein G